MLDLTGAGDGRICPFATLLPARRAVCSLTGNTWGANDSFSVFLGTQSAPGARCPDFTSDSLIKIFKWVYKSFCWSLLKRQLGATCWENTPRDESGALPRLLLLRSSSCMYIKWFSKFRKHPWLSSNLHECLCSIFRLLAPPPVSLSCCSRAI